MIFFWKCINLDGKEQEMMTKPKSVAAAVVVL